MVGFCTPVILDSRQRAASGPPGGVEAVEVGQAGRHTPISETRSTRSTSRAKV